MATSVVKYTGELRTVCTHLQSAKEIITDAPTDNRGKGAAFSPTDLAATSLATCMLTVMGIAAEERRLKFEGASAEVTKFMYSNPRRIGKIQIAMEIPDFGYGEKEKALLRRTAERCPVAESLHPDIEVVLDIGYTSHHH